MIIIATQCLCFSTRYDGSWLCRMQRTIAVKTKPL